MAWVSSYEICQCENPFCVCGGLIHSFHQSFEHVLQAVKPKRVFEWGPGLNTSLAIDSGAYVTTVDSMFRWVPRGLPDGMLSVHVVPVKSAWYVKLYGESNADLFFVDGRRRSECLRLVRAACREDAVVCLHDAQRERYHEALRLFENVVFIERGLALASKSDAVLKL